MARLAAEGTFHSVAQDVWDGDDVEYALERADWERREAAGPRPEGSPGGDHHP